MPHADLGERKAKKPYHKPHMKSEKGMETKRLCHAPPPRAYRAPVGNPSR